MFLIRSCQGDLLCDARPNSVEGKHAAVSMHGAAKDRRSLWAERRQLANWPRTMRSGSSRITGCSPAAYIPPVDLQRWPRLDTKICPALNGGRNRCSSSAKSTGQKSSLIRTSPVLLLRRTQRPQRQPRRHRNLVEMVYPGSIASGYLGVLFFSAVLQHLLNNMPAPGKAGST